MHFNVSPEYSTAKAVQNSMENPVYCSIETFLFVSLRDNRYGLRNSLLIAPMPTASTAQILGNNESFEPYTSNIYSRRVLSGEFQVLYFVLIQ